MLVAGLLLAPAAASADPSRPPFGRLIVRGYEKAWLVPARGRIVPLAGASALDWSPSLRLLAATGSQDRLSVRTATGKTLWARDFGLLLGAPRWSSGPTVRLAFLAGRAVRIVDGRGGHEVRLGRARDVAPAWRPGYDEIAVVRPSRDVVLLNDSGRELARWHPGRIPVSLSWTGDGSHLVVSLRYSVVVLSGRLVPQWSRRTASIVSAVAAPEGSRFALLTARDAPDGRPVNALDLRDVQHPASQIRLAQAYALGRIVWSPDARFVMVERPPQRDWLLVDVHTRRARGLDVPHRLRPLFDGVLRWLL